MKKLLTFCCFAAAALITGCGGSDSNTSNETTTENKTTETTDTSTNTKGIGKFQNVQLTHPLDEKMVAAGKSVYEVKCASCHKLTEEKLVGPGWKGVTDRRAPEWIMNFTVNTDEMLAKDQTAKNLLEVCLVKMPNQNLNDDDARHVLEFMRKNDGKN
jgi:cytochrome c2